MRSIEAIAVDWVAAELERKMRKREARLAWLLAFQSGVRLEESDDVESDRRVLVADTDDQREALRVATAARARYVKSAAHAGALRSGMTNVMRKRGMLSEPNPDEAIMSAYATLCATNYANGVAP